MDGTQEQGASALQAISNAMIRLHKDQFGRGPNRARSEFAGPDALLCVLEDVLLPAELKMIEMGDQERVREARIAYQVATAPDFIAAVEQIVYRKVRAFASGVDSDRNVVFENFFFEPASPTATAPRPPEPGPAGAPGSGVARGHPGARDLRYSAAVTSSALT